MNPQTPPDDPLAADTAAPVSPAAGLAEVTRSLRVLARNSRNLVIDAGGVLERELAMAISISERLRDESISPETLERVRPGRLNQRLRDDAHRIVDLVADVGGVAAGLGVRFVEQFADTPRSALVTEEPPAKGSVAASA